MGEGDQGFVKCSFLLHRIPSRAASSPLFYLFGQSQTNGTMWRLSQHLMDRGKSSILNINLAKISKMCIDFKKK